MPHTCTAYAFWGLACQSSPDFSSALAKIKAENSFSFPDLAVFCCVICSALCWKLDFPLPRCRCQALRDKQISTGVGPLLSGELEAWPEKKAVGNCLSTGVIIFELSANSCHLFNSTHTQRVWFK